jgi:hypothetical protein
MKWAIAFVADNTGCVGAAYSSNVLDLAKTGPTRRTQPLGEITGFDGQTFTSASFTSFSQTRRSARAARRGSTS